MNRLSLTLSQTSYLFPPSLFLPLSLSLSHIKKKKNSLSSHLKTKLGECQLSLPAVRVCEVSKEERK